MSKASQSQQGAFLPSANPPTWLGVMGGGQLGRMFAHAAQAMGYKVAVLEPAISCPAGDVAERLINADYGDSIALGQLSALCAAVTTEFENVPADSMNLLAHGSFVAPAGACVAIAQDRIAEKRFFVECAPQSGVMPAPHKVIASLEDIAAIGDELLPGILKTVRMGYDGKGQVRVASRDDVRAAFAAMKGVTCLLEKMLPLAYEVSVLTARGHDGMSVVYPIAENVHRDGILFTTTVPGPNVAPECAQQAQDAARAIIAQLGYVGVLCIEFFVLADGSLVVNEMAPRPHNSGHYTIDACVTSQFAQQVRAMAKLPLGDCRQHSPAVMLNILGDVWFENDQIREPAWDRVLALPGAYLHLYGKDDPRRGRKMGHVTFVAPTLGEAQEQLRAACAILGIAA
ncbi:MULTISPECIES: 5-(carboxyamino)imidazole ribonucleotide synthase [unclassified Massilia]|uniref:5-(carboxyamino)imidazole ribonucleotide synthase n=1 Tax=unclassified Massilia TaxID=2609279 RepID=UPI001786638A|nr:MULTISPECIES: 5-(carboxyamino)imidazole ribonucleotide synthase [unclassified Massilia]MBD8532741.1 5-(carboxyamino)imidazole ribonucleotide synthase [Massilia sp. CFBP 13647]MBD8676142.1 5-(carboxyamino)imidazole ribonucleotide synthase [Massilia sp. CFBP 13721]